MPSRVTGLVNVPAHPVEPGHRRRVQVSNNVRVWAPRRHTVGGNNAEPTVTKELFTCGVQLERRCGAVVSDNSRALFQRFPVCLQRPASLRDPKPHAVVFAMTCTAVPAPCVCRADTRAAQPNTLRTLATVAHALAGAEVLFQRFVCFALCKVNCLARELT